MITKKRIRKVAELLGFRYSKGLLWPVLNTKTYNLPPYGYRIDLSWGLLCALAISAGLEEMPLNNGIMADTFLFIEKKVME